MDKKRKYILKDGVVLRPYGVNSHLDNENGTDEIFEMLIKAGRAKESDFITQKTTRKNGNNK